MSTFKLRHQMFALCLAAFSACTVSAAEQMNVQLEGIADGDTIYVRQADARATLRVRLAMIDAPEKKQLYGMEAKATLTQLLRGAGELHLDVHGEDRYGRLIAIVKDDRGRNINAEMVSQGGAWVYEQFAAQPEYSNLYPQMVEAERNARDHGFGLWADPLPEAPWDFRHGKK
ncbi:MULTISPECIES: thermonuclease family protein [Pseudomonas syringae group]|uniref:thermonuclease family protein n=1 Tax=Pseudomonas syringae group TaxID=136849 RepID=UPI001604BE23|nr:MULTISPECIES: thermonuclease family protein [Pseudomonas syringae group]MDH4602488.1 thermonuclease family protein [Pseudomonas syringae pv. papulans]